MTLGDKVILVRNTQGTVPEDELRKEEIDNLRVMGKTTSLNKKGESPIARYGKHSRFNNRASTKDSNYRGISMPKINNV